MADAILERLACSTTPYKTATCGVSAGHGLVVDIADTPRGKTLSVEPLK